MLGTIIGNIAGTLTSTVCEQLYQAALKVPNKGAILDLNCGLGRSTVVLAKALSQQREGLVIAVDGHITQPRSQTPYQDGTTMKFLINLRKFQVTHRVVPLVCPVGIAANIVGKRCANLVVVQSPQTSEGQYSEDAMHEALGIAKSALRKGGQIAVCCPNPLFADAVTNLVDMHFAKGFTKVVSTPELCIVEGA